MISTNQPEKIIADIEYYFISNLKVITCTTSHSESVFTLTCTANVKPHNSEPIIIEGIIMKYTFVSKDNNSLEITTNKSSTIGMTIVDMIKETIKMFTVKELSKMAKHSIDKTTKKRKKYGR